MKSRLKNEIQFIYFDIGGVVIIDFSKTNKWEEMLEDLDIPIDKRDSFGDLFDRHEQEICKGEDIKIFINEAKEKLNVILPENYAMTEDFVDRFEVNESIHPILYDLVGKVRLGLLTNMYPEMYRLIEEKGILPKMDWGVMIDSSIEKVAKPEDEIFELAERLADVKPENLLFVENTKRHVDAVAKRGWQTLLYDPSNISDSNKKLKSMLNIQI